MKQDAEPARKTFPDLVGRQLLVYARELGEHHRREKENLQDILSRHQEEVRDLKMASIRAQEEERQWVAYEVHDRIAQTLASVFQQLQILESMTRTDPEARQVAVRASILLREAIRESRNIMNDLHPPILDEFGVVPLIKEELGRFQEDTGCQVELEVEYRVRPPQQVEVVLYRIFHEAMINIRRHASSATRVAVSLISGGREVNLLVQDDGPGFDVEAATRSGRVGGLMSMRRRAEIAGGDFQVTSTLGRGAAVAVRVPLNGR